MFSFMDLASSVGKSSSTMNVSTRSVIIVASLLLIAPVLAALVQGGAALLNFRRNYADAPLPKIPSHGVVIAGRDSLPEESLRLLVIGDSLAVGVGQSVSCTPLMPEAIATQIASATGKAVYWTCFGETGASTPWIIRMIEEANVQKYSEFKVPEEAKNDCKTFQAEGSLLDEETIEEWKQKLYLYRQSFRELYFDPESWGPFEIVVLVTGTNDLKATIFPFLLDEEDKELRRQIKSHKGGAIEDVKLFIETLNRKMERGLQRTLDEIITSAEELSETVRQNLDQMESYFDGSISNSTSIQGIQKTDLSTASVLDCTQGVNSNFRSQKEEFIAPLFVLPGSPIRLVPAFRRAPLQWLAVPVFDFMDDMKKAFAFNNPSDILFVEDCSLDEAIDYESRRGKLWNDKQREQVLLKVKSISSNECDDIEEKMKTYYESKGAMYDTINSEVPLSRWPGKPGTKIFSCDTIHPNEAGYDMYGTEIIGFSFGSLCKNSHLFHLLVLNPLLISGRHIGNAIVQRLQEKDKLQPSKSTKVVQDSKHSRQRS
jgi:hypothetical protein